MNGTEIVGIDIRLLLACGATFAVGVLTTWLGTFGVREFALRHGIVAKRNARRTHERNTPLLGGTAIFLTLSGLLLVMHFIVPPGDGLWIDGTKTAALIAAFALVWGIGAADDFKELKAPPKLIVQIVAASIVVFCRPELPPLVREIAGIPSWVAVPVLIVWIVGITNAMNMIDGLDGLCSGIGGISALTLTFTILATGAQPGHSALITATLAGCCLGFLFHNFNPARIFLGDSGSLLIGFALAVVSMDVAVKRSLFVSLSLPLMVLGLPLMDVALSILRRKRLERRVFAGDRGHIHHRLQQIGVSHRWAVTVLWMCSAYLNACAFLLSQVPPQYAWHLYGAIIPTLGFWFMALLFVERRLSYQAAKYSQFFMKQEDVSIRDRRRLVDYVRERMQLHAETQEPFIVAVIECQDFLREMAHERPYRVVAFYMNLYGILKGRLRSSDLVARVTEHRFVAVLAGAGGSDGSDGGIIDYLGNQVRELQMTYRIFQSHPTRPEGLKVLRYPKDTARIWQLLALTPEELGDHVPAPELVPSEDPGSARAA